MWDGLLGPSHTPSVAKSSKVFAKVFAEEIKEANVEETGDIAYKIMKKYPNLTIISPLLRIHSWKEKYGRNGDSPVRF